MWVGLPAVVPADDVGIEGHARLGLRGGEGDTVLEHMGRLLELKVGPVAPGGAVLKGDRRRVVVVFEAVARAKRMVEGDAPPHEVGGGLVLPAELEAIAVAAVSPLHRKHPRVAVVPGPAAVERHRKRGHEEIPAVVGIFPGAAACERVPGAWVEFAGEAIGILSLRAGVEVAEGIAVHDRIVGGTGSIVVLRLLSQADLQATVAIVVKHAPLHAVVAPLDLQAVVRGMADLEALDHPVIAREQDAPRSHSLGLLVRPSQRLEAEHGSGRRGRQQTKRLLRRARA